MSCIIYYNGKQYSEQDFKNLINKLKDKYGTNDNTNSSNSSSNSEGDRNRLKVEIFKGNWTENQVKENPDKIFIFGDNIQRTGKGGQAIIRDNDNAFGIATKKLPNTNKEAYFSDNELEENKKVIDVDIQNILDSAEGRTIVFPQNGLGTGLAKLKEKAPKTFEYLNQRLKEEFDFDNETGQVINNNQANSLFPVKINQFQYTLNTETGEVIHNSKSKGDIVETNETQIGKVYAEYAKQNNLPVQEFNLQFYSKVFDKVVNVNNGNFVTQQEILNLFDNRQPMEKVLKKVLNNLTKSEFTYDGRTIATDFKLGEQQEKALENLIDFVNSRDMGDNIRTLKGYAGTGKTSIIGYLQKYFEGKRVVFSYMAPTHAATAQLAITTSKLGNTELPNTYASSIRTTTNFRTGAETISFTKKLEKSLKLDSKRHVGHTKVIIVDEASMLNPKQVKDLNDLSSNEDVLVIYMGDDMQIPAVDTSNAKVKPVSPVFKKEHTLELTQVFRQSDNNLLDNLTKIREEKDFSALDITAKEGDNSLIIPKNRADFNSALLEDFKNDPENTIFIAYTNQAVQNFNKGLKETLTGTTDLIVGDKIVGYLGMGSKQVTDGLANSISYVVKDIKYNSTNTAKISITSHSKTLDTLHSLGVKNTKGDPITGSVITRYYQLSESDSLRIEGATQEDMDKNNLELSNKIKYLFEDYIEALQSKQYGVLDDIKKELSDMFATLDLGGDYIYDYAQNKLVSPNKLSLQATPQITNTLKSYFSIKKGVDYGYAITAHKSQGMTVDNVYVDTNNIETSAANIPIIDENKKQITTEKKSILYVSLSRGKNKVVVSPTALTKQSEPVNNTGNTTGNKGNVSDVQANVSKSLDFKGVLEFPESRASEYAKAIKTYIFENIGIKDVSKMVHIDKNVKSEYIDDNGKNKNFIYDFLYINKKGDKYVVKLIDDNIFIDPEITSKYESFKC